MVKMVQILIIGTVVLLRESNLVINGFRNWIDARSGLAEIHFITLLATLLGRNKMDANTKTLLIDIVGKLQFNTLRRAEKDSLSERVKKHIRLDGLTTDAKEYIHADVK